MSVILTTVTASAAPPNLSGTWAIQRVTRLLDKVPVVGSVSTKMMTLLFVKAKQKRNKLKMTATVCAIKMKPSTDVISIGPIPGLARGLSGKSRVFTIKGKGPKFHIHQPETLFQWGMKLKNPAKDALPTTPDDPRIIDVDGDYKPGMTIRIKGLIKGELYVVQRDWSEWNGTLVSPNRIEGNIKWRFDRVIVDRSSPLLPKTHNARADQTPRHNTFTMVRVPDNIRCKTLLRDRKKFFSVR